MLKHTWLLLISLQLTAQKVDTKRLDSLMASPSFASFSGVIVLASKHKTIYHQAFGYQSFENQTPLSRKGIFELASLSKQFTAMIIMMLQEKGLLDFDDLVEKYLDIPYKGIRIRHLLTHTSGLPDYQQVMEQYWDKNKVAGNAEILEYINRYAPLSLFSPGEAYQYSNTGYVLLASIAEKVTGIDFVTLCQSYIFRPLKMRSTAIRSLQEKQHLTHFAKGHIYVANKSKYLSADSFPSANYTIWLGNRKGPGRVSSSSRDLLKWNNALAANRLVKSTTMQTALAPMVLNNGKLSYYGFGWELKTDPLLGSIAQHTGDNPGYAHRMVRYIDKGYTLIVLSNNAFQKSAAIEAMVASIFSTKK